MIIALTAALSFLFGATIMGLMTLAKQADNQLDTLREQDGLTNYTIE